MISPTGHLRIIALVLLCARCAALGARLVASASSSEGSSLATGALDGDRFSAAASASWTGRRGESNWWWQVSFSEPRTVGALLQIVGDHDFVFRNAPRSYVWQASLDGVTWRNLPETARQAEQRCFRLIRLTRAHTVRGLRLRIDSVSGDRPVLREVEFFAEPAARADFPAWILAVNTTHEPKLPNHGQEFIPLARSCAGWTNLQAQQVWLDAFNPEFVNAEPRPLAAFLSGNFKDWCEVNREHWRGASRVLKQTTLPIWASCGGAQGLAILAETGVDHPWDCPHCRDPKQPLLPIYTHIGHTGVTKCGDYSACIHERGPHQVVKVADDPVLRGLPAAFQVMESHCGQIEWPPAGWTLIATAGKDTLTKTQCLRLNDRPIYAAQFHIEMSGTPENSRAIMSNFLGLARDWNARP